MRFHYYTYFCLLLLFLLSMPIKFIKGKLVRKPGNRTRDISQYATEKPEQCSPVMKAWVCLISTSWDSLLMWVLELNLSTVRGTTLLSHRDEVIVLYTGPQDNAVCRESPNLLLILRHQDQGLVNRDNQLITAGPLDTGELTPDSCATISTCGRAMF